MYKLIRRWTVFFISLMATIIAVHFLFEHSLLEFFDRVLVVDHVQPVAFTLIVMGLSLDILLPIPSSMLAVWAVVSLGLTGGVVTIWIGLCVACMFGYWLGACSSPWLLKKFVKTQDMIEARRFSSRYGMSALVLLRAVPVLAEASVLTAGLVKMPFRRFMLVTSLSNAGIALVYAGISAYLNVYTSFAGAIAAGIAVPVSAWLAAGLFGRLKSRPLVPGVSPAATIQAAFKVDYSFPIYFTSQTFTPHNRTLISLLDSPHGVSGFAATKVQFVVDRDVIDSDPDLRNRVSGYCRHHALDWGDAWFELPGGDAAKKQEHIDALHRHMLDRQLDRHSYVVVIGGGGALDAAGYAAATFHRGIRTIRMPTTVLAQNDAGIGVKSGINAYGIKNLMGSFTVPHAVINDSAFLATLPARVFRSGFAEAVKVSLIRDRLFFNWIENNVPRLNRRDEQATQYLIRRCAQLHINQICHGGDPFETGSARPLDYGHWSAHKLESLSRHQLLHGEAVAIGMALDALYAVEIGLLEQVEADRLIRLLQQLGFNLWHPGLRAKTANGANALLAGLEEFRQHLGGELCITLLTNIGRGIEVNTVDTGVMLVACDKLFACASYREYLPGNLNEIDSIA